MPTDASNVRQPGVFLRAEWRDLIMLNYEVDPQRLQQFIPRGTSLDLWQGRAYVSLVAFNFLKTRVLGIPILGHRNFEEINLRLYVVRETDAELRRGVVFIKEFVPRTAIAWVARTLYNENYVAAPMRHHGSLDLDAAQTISYEWKVADVWHRIGGTLTGPLSLPEENSEAEFITEHYWGYAKQRDGSTVEYQVEHPPWRVAPLRHDIEINAESVYGELWKEPLGAEPRSSFIAEGSPILVRRGVPLSDTRMPK